jgi:hypothetical protein
LVEVVEVPVQSALEMKVHAREVEVAELKARLADACVWLSAAADG